MYHIERYCAAFLGGAIVGFFMPTKGFMLALVIMCGFNVWCGMRADGVSIINCKKFSLSKLAKALGELLLYVLIAEVIFSFMHLVGDSEQGLVVVKTMVYAFAYVYLQNGFKNLVQAYPKDKALRMIYHIIRFEFRKAMPSHISEVINKIEEEVDNEMKKENDNK